MTMSTWEKVLALYSTAVVLALSYVLAPNLWAWRPQWKDVLDTTTALGTVGAVIAALLLTRRSEQRNEANDMLKARLACARLTADLEVGIAALEDARAAVVFHDASLDMSDDTAVRQAYRSVARTISRALKRPDWDIPLEVLEAMIPLPNSTAHRLQYGCRKLVVLNQSVQSVLPNWDRISTAVQKEHIVEWGGKLWGIGDYLVVAYRECSAAAELGAPPPTSTEIYGDPGPDDWDHPY